MALHADRFLNMSQYKAGLAARVLLNDGNVTSIQGCFEESEARAVSIIMSMSPFVCLVSIIGEKGL